LALIKAFAINKYSYGVSSTHIIAKHQHFPQGGNLAMSKLLSFLNQDSYQLYNRHIARYCQSINAAVMLAELINRHDYHHDREELVFHEKYGHGWFYLTHEKCEERTCLTRREQDTSLKILECKGFLEHVNFGLPQKRYFRLNDEKILDIFGLSKKHSKVAAKDNLECERHPTQFVTERQTLHIYKELQEEPDIRTPTTTSQKVVVAVVDKNKIKEDAEALKDWIDKESEKKRPKLRGKKQQQYQENYQWGRKWMMPLKIYEDLMKIYDVDFVREQVQEMVIQQCSADDLGTKDVLNPESLLKKMCRENFKEYKKLKEMA
jgi:hypothetical protein